MKIDDFTIALIDLAGDADAHLPTEAELEAAPVLSDWSFSFYPGTELICMIGIVSDHPRLPNGPATTRPLVAIALDEGWMKTEGRHYKLGPRAR